MLSDPEKRKAYDRLILGDAADMNHEFENQDSYVKWEKKSPQDFEKRQANIRDKLRKYKDYNDFLKAYENH